MTGSDLRIAVLSDVHGNAFAAEAVLRDMQQCSPDLTVNLGDQVWGQADPLRALELQRGLNALEVRGNNDEVLALPADELPSHKRAVGAWLTEQLPLAERKRLAALPLRAVLADGEVLASHGTPASPWDSLLIHYDSSTQRARRRTEDEIAGRLQDFGGYRVYLVGHMHRADTRTIGDTLLVNVGPVNWPNDGDPRAAWLLLERRGGVWHAEHRRVAYDYQAAARWIRESGAPDREEIELILEPKDDILQDS
ncbi:metallophosphoesterase family protein [Deinococcus sp. SL84]|uniref:metallophosphoesterase family protein n=1 Tax=Deinococcus sp. SL84 TaxID=2994663 RepID=UPI0022754249|nr:metallophosphoesterase family protein [Deinococcus sp. SL84]MCY1701824.1 metallophosphoesterase family protein [Deinococcus sp. SL84]